MFKYIVLPFAFVCSIASAQTYTLQDFVSSLQDDEHASNENWISQMEELAYLNAHPMDINKATKEDFMKIPILSDKQIEDIHTYIFLYGGLRSLSELIAVESIDYVTRNVLSLFFYAGQDVFQYKDTVNVKNLFAKAKHELTTRLDIPLYYREGYMHSTDNGGYHGSPLYSRVQYRMQSMNHLQIGLNGEKDAGEPFRGNHGFDSYGGYFLLKNIKCLRTMVVGDYKLGFGEGLVVNNGFSIGKANVFGTSRGIRANTSVDEYNYFRGAAASMKWANVSFTAWVSKRKLDATLNDQGEAQTLITSGYHRTSTELSRKRNLGSFVSGGDISWSAHGFQIGATGYYQKFDKILSPGDATYRKYYPRGDIFGVMGVHYGYNNGWLTFSGETAYSTEKGGVATLNNIVWRVNSKYKLTGSQRYYQAKYYSFYASALSENSNIQNETGGMIKLDAQPNYNWNVMAYADFFYNPWVRYRMTHSSAGQDFVFLTEYKASNHHSISLRYQLKRKESADIMQTHNRASLKYTASPTDELRLQTILNLHALQGEAGVSLSQDVRYKFRQKGCSVASVFSYFNTPNYATRVYVNEPSLQSAFSYPALYGHGLRSATTGSYAFLRQHITLEAKFGVTCFLDRKEQSSGMQTIYSRWKSDISVQLRLRI